jgi:two-component SAPR family response regulator
MLNFASPIFSRELFLQKTEGKRVVLIYPWSNLKTLFLSAFLDKARDGLLYYRVSQDTTNVAEWLESLVAEFKSVLGKKFGSETAGVLKQGKPAKLGAALAADIGNISSDPLILYLDDVDLVTYEDEFTQWATAFVNALPKHVQLVVSARALSRHPWDSLVASGDAVVLGVETRRNNVVFTPEDPTKPQLECYALGRGTVVLNGKPITTWEGTLPRTLTFFLIDRPLVTRDEIFSAFWPDLNVKDATNVFHVTKRKVNERITNRIEDGNEYELTQYTSGFYIASDRIVRHYDVHEFQEAVQQALVAADDRREQVLYARAIDLYRAPFLQTVNMPWANERRDELRRLYAVALTGMGRIHLRKNELNRALGYLSRAAREAPEREDVHRDVMRLYLEFGMVHEARQQYDVMKQVLEQSGGLQPTKESRELLEQIKSKS